MNYWGLCRNTDPIVSECVRRRYQNKAGALNVLFGDIAEDGIHIAKGEYAIDFSIPADKAMQPQKESGQSIRDSFDTIKRSAQKEVALKEALALPDSAIAYADTAKKAEYLYSVENDRVKESILLSEYAGVNVFPFTIQLTNLTMRQTGKEISFVDGAGNIVFYLEPPYMVDANGEVSYDVEYRVVKEEGNAIQMETVVSEAYLTAKSTAYPVLIDPTFSGSSSTRDTFVACKCSNPNSCSCSMGLRNFNTSAEGSNRYYLRTGKDTAYGVRRSYINFDGLYAAIRNKTVLSANLELYVDSSAGAINVTAKEVTSSWYNASTTMNWRTKAPFTTTRMSPTGTKIGDRYNIDVSSMAMYWPGLGSDRIYGMMLSDNNESNTNVWTTFRSADHTTVNTRPKLIVRVYVLSSSYWHSDANYVGRWTKTPQIKHFTTYASSTLAGNASTLLANSVAVWNNAGIAVTTTTGTHDMPVHMGDKTTLIRIYGLGTQSDYTVGLMRYGNTSSAQYLSVNGASREIRNIHAAEVFLFDMQTLDNQQKTLSHEIGHALGYAGHISTSGALMFANVGSFTNYTPNANEINHMMIGHQ